MRYRYRSEDELKDSGVEWLGKIPKDWNTPKISSIIETLTDYVANGSFESLAKNVNYLSEEDYAILIRTQDNSNGFKGPFVYIDEKAYNFLSKSKVYPNDIIISNVGAVGNVFKAPNLHKPMSLAPNSILIRTTQNNQYIYYLLQSAFSQEEIRNIVSSTAQPKFNKTNFKGIKTIIPNQIEQEKIANFLDEKTSQFDLIISKKEKLIERLEEAKKSLISEVVTGKVKVVKTDDGYELVKRKRDEMKDSGVEWLGEIPKDWNITKLKYIGEAITGLTYSPNDIVGENEGTLVLRSSNVQNGRIVLNDNVYVNMDIPKKLITREGDIIICSRNGSRALIGKNACIRRKDAGKSFGAFMTIFRSRYYEYLNFVFNSHIFKAQSGSFLTSTINQLTIGNLNSFIIALPNEKEQDIIVKYLCNKTLKYNSIIDKLKG